jgi:fructose-bisphosphate aldolase class II
MAKAYGIPVILHTDHAAKKLLPWIDGLLMQEKSILKKQEDHYLHLIC